MPTDSADVADSVLAAVKHLTDALGRIDVNHPNAVSLVDSLSRGAAQLGEAFERLGLRAPAKPAPGRARVARSG